MYLKQTPQKSGRVSLSIVEGWWDPKLKRARQHTVENLGYLDELEKVHDDPIAWGKARAQALTNQKKISEQEVLIGIHPGQKIDKRSDTRKNIGCAIPLSIYSGLNIEYTLRNHTRNLKTSYDVNAILRLLVAERICNPSSKLSAWHNKGNYFFRTQFSDDDVYRSLDVFAQAKDKLIAAMNRAIAKAKMRDLSAVYYDVTNYYFEIDQEDSLRRKGVSKEHRTEPIVQMGLLQDAKGIPLAYRKFPGNTSDCATMIPVLEDMKHSYQLERIVTVADKGLNCSENIAAAVASGDGFVFSQSVRGTKSDSALKAWITADEGYTYKSEDGQTFKWKSKQGYKTVHLKANDTSSNKAQDVDIEVKYVAFWSEKYARRAQHERQKAIDKAKKLIANPGAYTKATSHGAAQYIKNLHFNKETGEIIDSHTLDLDWSAITEAEKYDGYYLIVTSEKGWSNSKIINTYRELWKIEESFKITKSELKTRPVYVWTPQHIEAHFLICYIALVILRLLQVTSKIPCSVIREEIAAMSGTNVESNWWVFDHRTDASDLLVEILGLEELKLKNLTTTHAMDILAKAAKGKIPQSK